MLKGFIGGHFKSQMKIVCDITVAACSPGTVNQA